MMPSPSRSSLSRAIVPLMTLVTLVTCRDTAAPEPPRRATPASVEIVRGNGQNGVVGAELPDPLVVRVLDAAGRPIAGQSVTFHVTAGGGSIFSGASVSNADGIVQERWTLGTSTAALQEVEARAVDNVSGAKIVFATFRATPVAAAPDTLKIVSGDAQQAAAGSALPDSLVVRIADRYGNPVSGATVEWRAAPDSGTLGRAASTSSATGRANNAFTVGPQLGQRSVTAGVGSALAVSFRATGVASAAARLVLVAGNGQQGAVNTVLPIALDVRLEDAFGNPVVGDPITWTVVAGGGSYGGTLPSVTRDSGIARVSWRLGPTLGEHRMRAERSGLAPVEFVATAVTSPNDVAVAIARPITDEVVNDQMLVRARVTAAFALASVKAVNGDDTTTMAFDETLKLWVDTLDVSARPYGPDTVWVVATDVHGTRSTDRRPIIVDHFPRVVVSSPAEGSTATDSVFYSATCSDDAPGGCRSLTLTIEGQTIASGTSSIEGRKSLASYQSPIALLLTGVDSRGQTTRVTRTVIRTNSTPNLYGSLDVGRTIDAGGGRILGFNGNIVRIKILSTGDTDDTPVPGAPEYGFLTPRGAIVASSFTTSPYAKLFEIRDGVVLDLGPMDSRESLEVSGDWAIFSYGSTLIRRNLATGTNDTVSTRGGNWRNDVTPDGDVAYWNNFLYEIFLYRAGASQQITDQPDSIYNIYSRTDGINIVYRRSNKSTGGNSIMLFTGSEHIRLSGPRDYPNGESVPRQDYEVAGGWTAYTKLAPDNWLQVWRRAPTGAQEQVTTFAASTRIAALGDDGAVVVRSGERLYLIEPGTTTARDVGPSSDAVAWRAGTFFIFANRHVYTIPR